jgi:hypothetical protein
VQRIGTWLAVLAIALQAAWPLLVNAKPRAVALVPLCSVDGVTHYLELPTGKTPLEESVAHGDHCPLCFFGDRVGLPADLPVIIAAGGPPERLSETEQSLAPKSIFNLQGARAPPVSRVVTSNDHNFGRYDEKAFDIGRAGPGAFDCSRVLRLGVLHG